MLVPKKMFPQVLPLFFFRFGILGFGRLAFLPYDPYVIPWVFCSLLVAAVGICRSSSCGGSPAHRSPGTSPGDIGASGGGGDGPMGQFAWCFFWGSPFCWLMSLKMFFQVCCHLGHPDHSSLSGKKRPTQTNVAKRS